MSQKNLQINVPYWYVLIYFYIEYKEMTYNEIENCDNVYQIIKCTERHLSSETDLFHHQKTTYKVHMDIFKYTLRNLVIKKTNVDK